MAKKINWTTKTKVVYHTIPQQFWCLRCHKSSNVMYFDGEERYCDNCFNGIEEEYEVRDELKESVIGGGKREQS